MSGLTYATQIQASSSSSKALRSSIEAVNYIPAFSVVTSNGDIANSNNVFHKDEIVGISRANTNAGFICSIIDSGEIENPAWGWAKGDLIFLNGTTLSTIPPTTGFRVVIGKAVDTRKILVQISESILL